jgi:protease-4
MKKKTWLWILGISLGVLTIGVGIICFGLLIVRSLGADGGLAGGDAVAVIRVEGIIQAGKPPTDVFGGTASGAYSDQIIERLKRANENPDVKAVVLRVNSPGGGVVASDEIYEQVAAMDKPLLVSMGTLAASGGYYISAPATEIWANRHTLTGSIGAIVQFISIEGLLDEYGVEAEVIKSGLNKDTGSLFREMTEEEKAIWQAIVDQSYDIFVQIIVEGRGLSEERVRQLADGRVYSGQQALELGLVDKLGNLDDVIDRAAELGGIEGEPRIIEYDQQRSLFGGLFGTLDQPSPVEELRAIFHLNTGPMPMYLYTSQ